MISVMKWNNNAKHFQQNIVHLFAISCQLCGPCSYGWRGAL